MRKNIYQNLRLFQDCTEVLESVFNVCNVINPYRLYLDSKARRSNTGEATSWEKKAIFRLTNFSGDTNPDHWKGKYEGHDIRIVKKGVKSDKLKEGINQITVPITVVNDEDRREQTFNRFYGPSNQRIPGAPRNTRYFVPNTEMAPQNGGAIQSQRTMAESLGDLSQLLSVIAMLTTALTAVKYGVFGTAARNAVAKLKGSKQGIEQAVNEIKKVTVKK